MLECYYVKITVILCERHMFSLASLDCATPGQAETLITYNVIVLN